MSDADKKIVEADVPVRTALIESFNKVRVAANQEETKEAAVDAALKGAASSVEEFVFTGGLGTVVDLRQALEDNWATSVNS